MTSLPALKPDALLQPVTRRLDPLRAGGEVIQVPRGLSLARMVRLAVADPVLRDHLVAVVNGLEVERARWEDVYPPAGASVELAVRPAGDGDKVLRSVLQLAVIATAAWLAGPGGVALLGTQAWADVASISVAVLGNLAVNALIPPPATRFAERESPERAYFIEGARNEARPGAPVPMLLGRHRMTPLYAGQPYLEPAGAENYFRFPFALSVGEINVTERKIGETLLDAFPAGSWEVESRTRVADPPHTLYPADVFDEAVGVELTDVFSVRTTQPETDEIVILLAARQGIGAYSTSGKKSSLTIGVEAQYRKTGESVWTTARLDAPQANAVAADLMPFEQFLATSRMGYYEALLLWLQWKEAVEQSGAPTGPVSYTFAEPDTPRFLELRIAVPRGQYDVAVRINYIPQEDPLVRDRLHWEALRSVTVQEGGPLPVRSISTEILRMRAGEGVNGILDTYNVVGALVERTLSAAGRADPGSATEADWVDFDEIDNPADLALYLMRAPPAAPHVAAPPATDPPRNPRPVPDGLIDWPAWAAFWVWCDENGFRFNLYQHGSIRREELIRLVCAAGRAVPCLSPEGKFSVVIDGPKPVRKQLFSARNVRGFRLRKSFIPVPQALRVPFINAEEGWRLDERFVVSAAAEAAGVTEDTATLVEEMEFPGVTDPDQVWTLARLALADARALQTQYHFEVGWEHLACWRGDRVAIEHDVIVTTSASQRVVAVTEGTGGDAGKAVSVTLDGPVRMEAGGAYSVIWRHVVDIGSGFGEARVADELLVDTDPGDQTTLVFTTPPDLADAPNVGDLLVLGRTGTVVRDALVRRIIPADGARRAAIECIPYAPERFDAAGTPSAHIPNLTPAIPSPNQPIFQLAGATDDGVVVLFTVDPVPGAKIGRIEVAYREASDDGGERSWIPLPDLPGSARRVTLPHHTVPGRLYDVRIVLWSTQERPSPALIVTDIGADDVIAAPTGFTASAVEVVAPSGHRMPGIEVSADAATNPRLQTFVVEIREQANPELPWRTWGGTHAEQPRLEIFPVSPGQTYELRARWRTDRGALSAPTDVETVTATAVLEATGPGPGFTLANDSVTQDMIADFQIRARHLAPGDRSNIFPDPECEAVHLWTVDTGSLESTATNVAMASARRIETTPSHTDPRTVTSPPFPVEPGQPYYAAVRVVDIGNNIPSATLAIEWLGMDAAGALTPLSTVELGSGNPGILAGVATRIFGQATAPEDARRGRLVVTSAASTLAARLAIGEPVVRRAVGFELVVPGGIQTSHLEADFVAAVNAAIERLVIASFHELGGDPGLTGAPDTWSASGSGVTFNVAQSETPSGTAATIESDSTGAGIITDHLIPARAGDVFRVRWSAWVDAVVGQSRTGVALQQYDKDGALLSTQFFNEATDLTTSAQEFTKLCTVVHASTARVRIRIRQLEQHDAETIFISEAYVFRANAGELIVDGAIKAAHLDVDSVDTDNIVDGSITNGADDTLSSGMFDLDGATTILSIDDLPAHGKRHRFMIALKLTASDEAAVVRVRLRRGTTTIKLWTLTGLLQNPTTAYEFVGIWGDTPAPSEGYDYSVVLEVSGGSGHTASVHDGYFSVEEWIK